MATKVAKPQEKALPVSDVDSLQVSLPQMLDLALGTPEVGAVNLNILHNFLHILLHQINLRSTKAEFRGEHANRIRTMVSSLKAGPSLRIHEYTIIDKSGKEKFRVHSDENFTINVDVLTGDDDGQPTKKGEGAPSSAPVTEREKTTVKKEKKPIGGKEVAADLKTTKGVRQKISPGKEGESETVLFVEPIVDGIAPSALTFKKLEQSFKDIQQRFQALEELSTNPELVERLKGKITDPLTDLWQIINITKRLDASEQGIDKLSTMLQDLIKGDATTAAMDSGQLDERISHLERSMDHMEQVLDNLNLTSNSADERTYADVGNATTEDTALTQKISASKLKGVNVQGIQDEMNSLRTDVTGIRKDVTFMAEKIAQITGIKPKRPTDKKRIEGETDPSQFTEADQMGGETSLFADDVFEGMEFDVTENISDRIENLERSVSQLANKVETAALGGAESVDMNQLVAKIQGLQTDMEKLNETADLIINEQENREVHLNAVLEQVELLKTIKADKEDIEDALADKADAQVLNRKVSHDQFDAACDDLARGLEDAIGKLGKQESIWQQALDEVQKEIEGKVDKMEISPLKDFVTNRLKSVQEKLKSISEMKRDTEAAGTKKILRDVQCISCDKNVVMKMEDENKFRPDPLPTSLSMKPYLTYELDKVRKQQRRLPHSRNMIQFEAALIEETKKQRTPKDDTFVKTPKDHLCNRYCGGSHTITTPYQRVMRMGHYLNEWGPEILQLTEGFVKGTDGKMYRSRLVTEKTETRVQTNIEEGGGEEVPTDQAKNGTPSEKRNAAVSRKRSSKKNALEVLPDSGPTSTGETPVTPGPDESATNKGDQ